MNQSIVPIVRVLTQSAKNHKENKMKRQTPALRLETSRGDFAVVVAESEALIF